MKGLHANVGSRDTALEKRPEVLKAVSVYATVYILAGVVNYLMRVVASESFIREQGIGVERGSSSDVLAYFVLQYLAAAARNHAGANLAATFQDADHCGLILAASSGNPALPFADVHVPSFAADESFVHFDFAAELRPEEIILHCKPDAVQHKPCRLLSDLHITRNLVAADSILAISDEPSCGHPLVKRDGRIFHHSADLDRELALCVVSGASPSTAIGAV